MNEECCVSNHTNTDTTPLFFLIHHFSGGLNHHDGLNVECLSWEPNNEIRDSSSDPPTLRLPARVVHQNGRYSKLHITRAHELKFGLTAAYTVLYNIYCNKATKFSYTNSRDKSTSSRKLDANTSSQRPSHVLWLLQEKIVRFAKQKRAIIIVAILREYKISSILKKPVA